MTTNASHHSALLHKICLLKSSGRAFTIVLSLTLVGVSPTVMFGQSNLQLEQQQREQQERDRQQREQQERDRQQREQQERDRQQREQQQREQQERERQQREQQDRDRQERDRQQREQQERDRQQREQQERDRQQREQQQRERQQREQQERDRQERDRLQREQQQREERQRQQTPNTSSGNASAASATANSAVPSPNIGGAAHPSHLPESDVRRLNRNLDAPVTERKTNSSMPAMKATAEKDHESANDLRRKLCDNGPCKPEPKPMAPDLRPVCKGGRCPCPPGQTRNKDGSCAAPAPVTKPITPQSCSPGQVWNGQQCIVTDAQQCAAGETRVGTSCQVDCTLATAGAQSVISRLRMARQDRDTACRQNSTGQKCQEAEADYDLTLNEYRSFLGGVPIGCMAELPDPIAI
jgi:hypothetical protein